MTGSDAAEFHPIQREHDAPRELPISVTKRAYEVYVELWGEQEALVTGWCRGGFATREIIALLYARSFPREEWRRRVDEANQRRKA